MDGRTVTPEERAVLDTAIRWAKFGGAGWENRLRTVVQEYHVSRQPLHTVEPTPCGVYANHSATMFCVLPAGHQDSRPDEYGYSIHAGYPGGQPGPGGIHGRRVFEHTPYYETMETHERPACPRFPGCIRHPKREAKR